LTPALLRLAEPARGAAETNVFQEGHTSTRSALRLPTLWWIVASGALVNFILYALATFLPAYLTRVHGFSLRKSGLATGIGYGVCGVLGGLLAGSWGDRLVRRRRDGRMLLASGAALVAAPIAFLGISRPPGSGYISVILITLSYGALNMYYGPVYSSIHDIVTPALRGTTMAIYFLAMYVCGASFGPLLTGHLSDRMAARAAQAAGSSLMTEGFKATGLHDAMFLIPILSVCLGLVLFAGSRTIVADMGKRDDLAGSLRV
jgi:sugar phosphate permease